MRNRRGVTFNDFVSLRNYFAAPTSRILKPGRQSGKTWAQDVMIFDLAQKDDITIYSAYRGSRIATRIYAEWKKQAEKLDSKLSESKEPEEWKR